MEAITYAAFALDGFEGAVHGMVELPVGGKTRAKKIVKALAGAWGLSEEDLRPYRSDLFSLLHHRNMAVHGGVWKDPTWEHPSGLSVSEAQQRVGLESAERAHSVCRAFISLCLNAP